MPSYSLRRNRVGRLRLSAASLALRFGLLVLNTALRRRLETWCLGHEADRVDWNRSSSFERGIWPGWSLLGRGRGRARRVACANRHPYAHVVPCFHEHPEFFQICRAVAIGFAVMGFIGYFVKLIHIPM
jgi:hypothetical protein